MSHIEGLDEIMASLEGMGERGLAAFQEGLAANLPRTVAVAKMLVGDDAQIRNSITSLVTREGGLVDGVVVATAETAVYREMGTGPVGMASNNGKAPVPVTYTLGKLIKFTNSKTGEQKTRWVRGWYYFNLRKGGVRFTRGQPARPYLYPAWQQTKEMVIQGALNNVQRRLKGE